MATVNKNFRIKHGLIVEGTSGTINGLNILTESQDSQDFILDLIGGETLVKSVGTNLSVDVAGELSLDLVGIVEDIAGTRLTTDGSTLNVDVDGIADDLTGSYDFATNSDVTSAIGTATTSLQGYADQAELDAVSTANSYTDGEITTALTTAQGYATTAQTNAEDYADGLASNYDAAGSAATAEQNAKDYADDLINDASSSSTEVWSAYKTSTEIGLAQAAAEQHADDAVAALVGSAPELLDTIQELATALENNPDIIADLQDVAAGKQNTLTAGANIDITEDTISVTGLDTDDVAEGTNLYFTNQRAIDAVGGSATSDNTPDTVVKRDANGNFTAGDITVSELSIGSIGRIYDDGDLIIENIDGQDVVITADDIRLEAADDVRLTAGEGGDIVLTTDTGSLRLEGPNIYAGENLQYVDSERVATRGYADGAASDAENNASAFADDLVDDLKDATTPFTAINVNDEAKQIAATATITTGSASTVYQWAKADYRSAKLLVKVDNGTHNEISEILVTLDSSDNVAITEYAIVGTNGSRGTITAVVSGSNVLVTVNPTDNSTVKVTGTLLK